MDLELNPVENLLVASSAVAVAIEAVKAAAEQGQLHPAGVYADPPGQRIYTQGLNHKKQLVAVVIPIGVAIAIRNALATTKGTEVGNALDAKLAAYNAEQEAPSAAGGN